MAAFAAAVASVLLELSPWLLLGAAAAGLLHVLLPADFVPRHLGRGRGGVAKAVALGVPLPLCSCGVIPAGLGLRRDGASPGATVGFLISTPQTGVDSVFVAGALLGWPLALFKVAAAFATGLVGGLLTDRLVHDAPHADARPAAAVARRVSRARAAIEHGVDVLRSIAGWLVVGVLASAAISVLVPPQAFATLTGRGEILAMLAALAISIPLYVCATASVPIAAALVAGGFPPGAALVFLMAGPATNVATIGAVARGLGRTAMLVYLATVVAGSLAAGLLFDAVLTGPAVAASHEHAHGSDAGPIAWASTVVLVALLAWFGLERVRARLPARVVAAARRTEIGVDGMTCSGCANRLATALRGTEGVAAAEVDLAGRRAIVHGSVELDRLCEAIAGAGFTPRRGESIPDGSAGVRP